MSINQPEVTGGGTEDSALRVTVATDSTGVLSVDDNGGSLTVDGTVAISGTVAVSAAVLPLPSGAATSALQTQPGVDIGDVTINNASGAAAVNVQDGGNSITVDGTVTANAGTGPFPVSDNADSLTVDAPVGTPLAARLSDGASFYDATKTGQLPAVLVGGRLDGNVGAWLGSALPTVGQKVMLQSIPVVIASNQASIPINDNFGSLTVDNAGGFAVTDGGGLLSIDDGGTNISIDDGNGSITIDDGGNNVSIDDGGNTISIDDGGGSISVDGIVAATTVADTAIGTTVSPNAPGFLVLALDAVSTAHALSVNASDLSLNTRVVNAVGAASVNIQDGGNSITVDSGAGALSVSVTNPQLTQDNAPFLDGTDYVRPAGFILDEVAGTALTEDDVGAARMDSKRAQITTLEDATTRGQRAAISAAGRLSVDASGVAVPITDNAGSLTIDAPVGTPVAARLSDGAAFYDAAKTGQLPTALVGARLDTNVGAWLSSTAPTVGSKTSANSIPVVIASDQAAVTVAQATATSLKAEVVGPTADNAANPTAKLSTLPVRANASAPGWTEGNVVPLSSDLSGRLRTDNSTWFGSTAPTIGQKTMANSIPIVVASDQTFIPVNGDVDHDAVNTLKNIQIAGNASPADVPPTVVSANSDRVRAWFDRSGAIVTRPRKIRLGYTAIFRLAQAAGRLDQTFLQVADTNKQWATLHHTGGSTKEVRLLKCSVFITAWDAATQAILELRQISTAPATGNPAITPTAHRRGGTAAEAVALYLPTTAGTDVLPNSPISSVQLDLGVMGAVGVNNPPITPREIILYNAAGEDPELIPPTLPVGTLDGWAVMLRTVGAPNVRMTVVMRFTEEIP